MTRKVVSEEESQARYRYGSVRILRDGQVRLSPRTLPNVSELDFSVNYVAQDGDSLKYIYDTDDYSVNARSPSLPDSFFMIFVFGGRVTTTCFNFLMTPSEVRKSVAILRKAGGGIERWIVPGLEYTYAAKAEMNAKPEFGKSVNARTARMLRVIRDLLDETRDLPVATQWLKWRRALPSLQQLQKTKR